MTTRINAMSSNHALMTPIPFFLLFYKFAAKVVIKRECKKLAIIIWVNRMSYLLFKAIRPALLGSTNFMLIALSCCHPDLSVSRTMKW